MGFSPLKFCDTCGWVPKSRALHAKDCAAHGSEASTCRTRCS